MKKFSPRNNNRRIRRLGVEGSIFVLLQPRYSIPSKEFFPLLPMSFFFLFFSFNSIKPFVRRWKDTFISLHDSFV